MKETISSKLVKAEAKSLGFDICGLAQASPVDKETSDFVKQWLEEGNNAGMTYLANYPDKRSDPQQLVKGTRTIISIALNYYPSRFIPSSEYQIAWYAYGKDYHEIIRPKLQRLLAHLQRYYPTLSGRAFCDTAPILERYWAWKAGLGWIGKNTLLIIPNAGSCFFLGELFIDAYADFYDSPLPDRCGNCTLCLDNCPTKALEAPHRLNANRCINYLTIENKNEIPSSIIPHIRHTVYGCNHCLAICPWNRLATPNATPELQPDKRLLEMTKDNWNNLSEEEYKKLFSGSAIKRAKYKGLIRNIRIANKDE